MRSDVTNSIFLRIKGFFNSPHLYLYTGIHMIDPNIDLYGEPCNLKKVKSESRELNRVNHLLFHQAYNK